MHQQFKQYFLVSSLSLFAVLLAGCYQKPEPVLSATPVAGTQCWGVANAYGITHHHCTQDRYWDPEHCQINAEGKEVCNKESSE